MADSLRGLVERLGGDEAAPPAVNGRRALDSFPGLRA